MSVSECAALLLNDGMQTQSCLIHVDSENIHLINSRLDTSESTQAPLAQVFSETVDTAWSLPSEHVCWLSLNGVD